MDNFKTIHYGFKVVIHDYDDELTPLYNLLKKQSTNLEGSKLFDELIDIHEKLAKKIEQREGVQAWNYTNWLKHTIKF